MLSNQFENIILEYKQDITAKKIGPPLITRFLEDARLNPNILSPKIKTIVDALVKTEEALINAPNPEFGGYSSNATPQDLAKIEAKKEKLKEKKSVLENQLAVKVLTKLEKTDPTKNKEYVLWLARIYIKDEISIEDVESTLADYLHKFHKLKTKHHLKQRDIGQYKDFDTFMQELDKYSNDLIDDDEEKNKKYNAEKLYDEKGILIIRPDDREAACRYGRGTRWCTSATKGHNFYQSYVKRGPLYIFVPRQPGHPGEKYQFHFEDNMFNDEVDNQLNVDQLIDLTTRFPALKDAFQVQAEKFGLIWLQKPKGIFKGENFVLEKYVKDGLPLYLMKPTDSDKTYQIIPKIDEFGGRHNMMNSENLNFHIKMLGKYLTNDGILNELQEHEFLNKYPELLSAFGLTGTTINKDPERSTIASGADIEKHGDIVIMTDKQGHRTAIKMNPIGRNHSGRPQMKMYQTSPWEKPDDTDDSTGRQRDRSRRSGEFEELNPYEVTLEHPELIDVYAPMVKQQIKDHEKWLKNLPDVDASDPAEMQEERDDFLYSMAPLLPYKLYDKEDVLIKSHVTPEGKPVVDYVIPKNGSGEFTIVKRDMKTAEIKSLHQVRGTRVDKLGHGVNHKMLNKQGDVYADASQDPKYQRLFNDLDSSINGDDKLSFLPSISYLEQYPGLRDLYKDTKLVKPKIKELSNSVVKDYGKTTVEKDPNDRYSSYDEIARDAKTMRNFIVTPKDAKDGESYAISWSQERPQYVDIYHSNKNGVQTSLDNPSERKASNRSQGHVLKMFPELRKLQMSDWKKFRENNPEHQVEDYTSYSRTGKNKIGEWSFEPSEVVENNRVVIEQFGPAEDNPKSSLPGFDVYPKQDNPFGEVGDRFIITLEIKDQRSKVGKISDIQINRIGKNTHISVPIDHNGNPQRPQDTEFEAVGVGTKENTNKLSAKEIGDFFRYYPELRLMIKEENIHPKKPHPALANKPDETGAIDNNAVQFSNFKLETENTNDPVIEKQYIIPSEEEYPGEFYTLYTYDPLAVNPLSKGQPTFSQYGGIQGALSDRGVTQLIKGEMKPSHSYYNKSPNVTQELKDAFRGKEVGTLTPNTPGYNALMQRFPDLQELIREKGEQIGDPRVQDVPDENIEEIGEHRVYTFKNRDGSDVFVVTPINNTVRGNHGEIQQLVNKENEGNTALPFDDGSSRKLATDEEDWEEGTEFWNHNSFSVNFESTADNPFLRIPILLEPFKDAAESQIKASVEKHFSNLGEDDIDQMIQKFAFNTGEDRTGMLESPSNNYLDRIQRNPELYRWFQEKAEERNNATNGVGAFINFLPITNNQMTSQQTKVPKLYGIDLVGIAKIGISNPLYLWQGRESQFQHAEQTIKNNDDGTGRYGRSNLAYRDAMKDYKEKQGYQNVGGYGPISSGSQYVVGIKPESGGQFIDFGNRGAGYSSNARGIGVLMQVPSGRYVNIAKDLPNIEKIVKPKELKAVGWIPSKTWGPRAVKAMDTPKLTNRGKPWIKSIQEFKMPDGIGLDAGGAQGLSSKSLPPGTGYLITLNSISSENYKKRRDGKIVTMRSPWASLRRVLNQDGIDHDFMHDVFSSRDVETQFMIYFANNRVAYILNSMGGSWTKYNLNQEAKKRLFFDPETGIFPELKPIFDQYAKSNKWLREYRLHDIISKVLFEGLGDKAYWELKKEKSKPNYGKLKWLKNMRLSGSYSNAQLKELGFFMNNGEWVIQQFKYDDLVGDGKLREMTLRPLVTGKAKIPTVGKKKIAELDVYDKHKRVDGEPEEYTDSDEVEKQVMKSMHKDEVKKMLSGLTKIEKIVIITRFGLDNGKDYNLEQVGDMIGKSRERVRQIEAKALRKMRNNATKKLWPEQIEESKKFPRTSEFLQVKELEDIKRLAGVYEPYVEEGDGSMGSNISKTASEISKIMKDKNIQPGTPEWFQLWFSKPYLTGEKPTGKSKRKQK